MAIIENVTFCSYVVEEESEETSHSNGLVLSDFVIDITEYEKVFLCKKGKSYIAAKFIDASDERNQESFEREIKNLHSLSHSFIVGFRGFSLPSPKTKNRFVIGMKYISGGSLQDILKNPPS